MNDVDLSIMQAIADDSVPPDIVRAEARLRMAQLTGDVSALDALIAEDLLFTGPDGQLGTKDADIAGYASGLVRFREHEPQELRARLIGGDVVVSALRARLGVEVGGQLFAGVYRYTRVWAREGDRVWRVVGGHVSGVPEPPA
jgi:ketosteroid isomerase-like protein